MTTRTLLAVALLTTPNAAIAAKPKPLTLKASSAWHVDFAEDRCRIARVFGEDKQQTFLFLDRYGPGEYFRLTVVGAPVQTSLVNGEASVQFGPAEKEQQLYFFNGMLKKLPALVFTSGARVAPQSDQEIASIARRRSGDDSIALAPVSEAQLEAITHVALGKPLRRSVILETGPMRAVFKVSDKCIDNLMTTWGIDVEKHKNMMRMPTPKESPANWVVSDDYPLKMLFSEQQAIVEFRLSVGPDGVPTACHIQSTTRPKEFDDAVCKSVMRRARFEPALDANGSAIASYYRNTVRFQMP